MGFHFLASEQPLHKMSGEDLQRRLPRRSNRSHGWRPRRARSGCLSASTACWKAKFQSRHDSAVPTTPSLTDDRPINEYYSSENGARRSLDIGHQTRTPGRVDSLSHLCTSRTSKIKTSTVNSLDGLDVTLLTRSSLRLRSGSARG